LFDRPDVEVSRAVKAWVAKLDPNTREYDHLLVEALWVLQSHHMVDGDLLKQVLRTKTGEARAAATRVLADEWERIPNAMEMIKPQVVDEFPRTRLEALRALSFVKTRESVETALLAVDQPLDYWLHYTLQMTIGALEPVWSQDLKAGTIARNNPRGLEELQAWEFGAKPAEAAGKIIKTLLAGGTTEPERVKAYDNLAVMKGKSDNGQAIFGRICVACHMADGQGVDYGPDLSQVASRLSRRDIIESIIDPNAKVDPKYITTNLETKDGEACTGFVVSETEEEVTLRIGGGKNHTVKKSDINKRESVKQSSMPEGLAGGMSSSEFLDLLAYLGERTDKNATQKK
jgi:putative heme-binding domain-containing protein